MRERYKNSFREKIQRFVAAINGNVILRSDLDDLGSSRQVSRALKALMKDDELIKLGYGVYAKSKKATYINRTILRDNFDSVCVEALDKLGIAWELGTAIQEYNEGRTQQVPVRFIIKLKNRFRGTLSDGSRTLMYEGNINAR